jgi:hypothetical protein
MKAEGYIKAPLRRQCFECETARHVHREKDYIVASHILIHFAIDCCNKVVMQRFCILLLPTKWDSPQFRLADVCMKELEADGNTTEAGY